MHTCNHLLDPATCSTCKGVPDSTLDDCIESGSTLAWFTPSVETQPKAVPMYSTTYKWERSSGETGTVTVPSWTPDQTEPDIAHDPAYPRPRYRTSLNGYPVEVIASDDPHEVRVREAVRDFGFLTRNRDLGYAISIGMSWDGFTTGMVEPEPDHLAVEGAGLPIKSLPTRPIRPTSRSGIKAWREGR